MTATQKKLIRRRRRKRHVRKRISGTAERPRLTVFRSHKSIYAQIIDDTAGRTLVSVSSKAQGVLAGQAAGGNRAAAKAVGSALAARAVEAGIQQVVFDRNGYVFHGRVKELADAAREGGLKF